MFGGAQPQQQQQQQNPFSFSTPAPALSFGGTTSMQGGLFTPAPGANLFGQQQLQQQAVIVRETTVFDQLAPSGALVCQSACVAIQEKLAENRRIRRQIEQASDVGEKSRELTASVRRAREMLKRAENAQASSQASRRDLSEEAADLLKGWGDDLATKSFLQPHATVELPPAYLWQHAKRCEKRLDAYTRDVKALSTATGADDSTDPERLARLVRGQYEAFSCVANRLASSHARLDDLKARFLRDKPQDPFAKRDREEEAERRHVINRIRAEMPQQQQFLQTPQQPQQQQQQQQQQPGGLFGGGAAFSTPANLATTTPAPNPGAFFGGAGGSAFQTTPASTFAPAATSSNWNVFSPAKPYKGTTPSNNVSVRRSTRKK